MSPKIFDLEQYEKDFNMLERYEAEAENDLKSLENFPKWKATDYEKIFLPHFRLSGIVNKNEISLQNSADLHIHTQWSDGDDLDKVLDRALELHLDAIAITDHDEIEGALEARRRVHERRLRLAVIPGCEVSSSNGHIGALFVMEKIPARLSAAETIQRIHDAGGIAVAHHPYSPKWIDHVMQMTLGCGDMIKNLPFDAVEVTNAVPGRGVKYNIKAIDEMKNHHIRVSVTGSSDAHNARFVGKGRTYYSGNEGVVSLRKAFKYGFTHGAEGYWKTSEKFLYYSELVRSIIVNRIKKFSSVN